MAELVAPTVRVHRSFLEAMAEFEAEGRVGDGSMVGYEIRTFGPAWARTESFEQYVQWLLDQSSDDAPRPENFVPSTTLWLVEDDEYLGRIAIRHWLTPDLLEVGGHIGYDVRASARRQGYATQMLRDCLPIAHAIGIDPALLTCDATNVASRKVIENNGGVFEDQRGEKLRYWVATAPTPAPPESR
jgi:predicted acetyltransferase